MQPVEVDVSGVGRVERVERGVQRSGVLVIYEKRTQPGCFLFFFVNITV